MVYYMSLNSNMFLWFNFWNILNLCLLNTNTWTTIVKFWCHHASKFGMIYINGGHIGFNYNHTSLSPSSCKNSNFMETFLSNFNLHKSMLQSGHQTLFQPSVYKGNTCQLYIYIYIHHRIGLIRICIYQTYL